MSMLGPNQRGGCAVLIYSGPTSVQILPGKSEFCTSEQTERATWENILKREFFLISVKRAAPLCMRKLPISSSRMITIF